MKDTSGFVYVLSNPCHDFLKVGQTQNNPIDRCSQLSRSPGTPMPFRLAACWWVMDCRRVEQIVHDKLDDNRLCGEFFATNIREVETLVKIIDPLCVTFDEWKRNCLEKAKERVDLMH